MCDLIGKDDCADSEKKYGIKYCKLDSDQCVYNGDPAYLTSNTFGCNKESRDCLYKPPAPPRYKWDCLNDPCYKDSIQAGNCDITAKRQSEHCIMIPIDKNGQSVTYCSTRANAGNAAFNPIDPRYSPYAS